MIFDDIDNDNFLTAPFPYFGGKSSVADIIWKRLGDVKHYIEPFFGSGAVLLNRPCYDPAIHIETINDFDGFVANVWRALQKTPDEVAKYCDWPVNHADLSARKKRICEEKNSLLEKLIDDENYYDTRLAGYWIWGVSCWIGSGLTSINQRPNLGDAGRGVHKISQRPYLSSAGMGVQEPYNANIYKWFRVLSERLRYVRVVCGDWTRVCGGNWQDNMGTVGIFFDPPYAVENRSSVYECDDFNVAHDVRAWAIERGDKKTYRICIAGYDEHEDLLNYGWTKYEWKTGGGYSKLGKDNHNCEREVLWFSPHCLKIRQIKQPELFDEK